MIKRIADLSSGFFSRILLKTKSDEVAKLGRHLERLKADIHLAMTADVRQGVMENQRAIEGNQVLISEIRECCTVS